MDNQTRGYNKRTQIFRCMTVDHHTYQRTEEKTITRIKQGKARLIVTSGTNLMNDSMTFELFRSCMKLNTADINSTPAKAIPRYSCKESPGSLQLHKHRFTHIQRKLNTNFKLHYEKPVKLKIVLKDTEKYIVS